MKIKVIDRIPEALCHCEEGEARRSNPKKEIASLPSVARNDNNAHRFSGQSVIEYFVVTAVILAVILSSGVIERMRERFGDYFNAAVAHMR